MNQKKTKRIRESGMDILTSPNRTTTMESLLGVVGVLLADDEETFIAAYRLATHDSKGSGHGAWVLTEEGVERKREIYNRYMKNRYRKNKEKL